MTLSSRLRQLAAIVAVPIAPCFAWPGAARAQTPGRFDPVRAVIRQVMDSAAIPGLGVAVARDGRIVWEEGFGWADREKQVAATQSTMFSLASISKPFTATGLMRLVEEGKVDLDAPANQYLGAGKITGFAGDAGQATVRRVMSHTAGLPLYYTFYYAGDPFVRPAMDLAIARYAILVAPPGQFYQYSNLGYGILDQIIERRTGVPYRDYMRTRVFLPLGLTRTSVYLDQRLEPYAAQRYDSQLRPIPSYQFDHDGGSAVYSSAHDLVRFGLFHLKEHLPDQQPILADFSIDAMHRVATPPGAETEYGLGWFYVNDMGWRRLTHTGGMPGVSTMIGLYPGQRVAVVVLANKGAAPVGRIAQDVLALVMPGAYADSLTVRRAQARRPLERPPFSPPAGLVGEWKGTVRTWQSTLPLSLTIKPDGDVHVALADQPPGLLSEASWANGLLSGRFPGTIPTPDARMYPHSILLQLRLLDGKLEGQATAQDGDEPVHFALTSYVELGK